VKSERFRFSRGVWPYAPTAKGFTLLELLIVLTIILIASSLVGATLYKGLGTLRLKSSAKEIAAALRYARSQAIYEKRIYIFSLDPENRLYSISAWVPSETLSPQSSPPGGEGRVRGKTLPEGITVVDKERVDLFFYPSGSSTGGKFSLTNEKGSAWTVQIEPSTGRVSLNKKVENGK
jgi:general secretion pathway protein H